MFNYQKPKSLITILENKHDFINAYSRELYRATRYNYPVSSLNIIIPEKITSQKIKDFIIDSFRESDIVYCNDSSQSLQVLLPYTPEAHLDIIIDRMIKSYEDIKKVDVTSQLKCEIISLTKNDDDIYSIIYAIESAENLTAANDATTAYFHTISKKLLTIVEQGNCEVNLVNHYCGMKVNYKATLVNAKEGLYTFETDAMQLAAMNNNEQTLIEIKKYGFHMSADVENIDFILNRVTLTNLVVMQYNSIHAASLTVELKEQLSAQLVSLDSKADINLSAVSFNEIYGCGDISQLAIDNNTLRLLINKDEQQYTLLVKFIYSKFNGQTQKFTLRIMDTSEKSMELFKSIVTKRSRECIQELKHLCA
ncbi:MAG: hypothetical protein ACI9TV_003218 [Sulfurimonas sp.]|jgi:hypothetical protein|uniref:hypothetical protein n=1 Tax=Sulfurimonas sp. TaxID=2022749 RepID=UPI0039E49358